MMGQTKILKGSPFRDAVKTWHKTLPQRLYGCDIDFALVSFEKNEIVAVLDVKSKADQTISDTTIEAYQWFIKQGVPVYLLTPDQYTRTRCPDCGKVDIVIDPDSMILLTNYETGEARQLTREEYIEWEDERRK